MTVEKSIVAMWIRTPRYTHDADGRAFAQALARKRVRFAFPDEARLPKFAYTPSMMHKAWWHSALLVTAISHPVFADTTAATVSRRSLQNGLTVLVQEDHGAPRVGVSVAYRVGQRDEPSGYPGMTTILAQLMRGPSLHIHGSTEESLRSIGARPAVYATRDRTTFVDELPASAWEHACWVESDRMAYLLSALDEASIDRSSEALDRETFRLLSWGDPLAETIGRTLYPRGHPYRRLAAREADSSAPDLDELRWFFQAWYGPDNATVAVVGDVDTELAHQLVSKYFGPVQKSATPRPVRSKASAVNEDNGTDVTRYGGVLYRFPSEEVRVAWPAPGWFDEGDAALAPYPSPQSVEQDIERVRAVTFEDVQRATVRYLSSDRRVVVTSSTQRRGL